MKKINRICLILIVLALVFSVTACTVPVVDSKQGDTDTDTNVDVGGSGDIDDPTPEVLEYLEKADPALAVPEGSLAYSEEFTRANDKFYADYTEEEKALYYTVWAEDTKVEIDVDITPYELAKINEAYLDYVGHGKTDSTKVDTYRKCNLRIRVNDTTYTYNEVGVRMRGNTSRRDFCTEDGEVYALVHLRFAFDQTFDGEEYQPGSWASELYHEWTDAAARKERKNRSFATMEKIYVKWNKNYDQTYAREQYVNRMFMAYGIYAPHISLAKVSIKQGDEMANMGVFGLYEVIDKQFIKRNFDKNHKGGDLYKCTWDATGPADMNSLSGFGIETPTQTFSYSLKTNDDPEDFLGHEHLKAFLTAVGSNGSDYYTNLEGVMDMDYFCRFEAVNYLVGNPDCIRNNYNNYYLYFTPDGVGYIIPYDYDRCLGVMRDWNPDGAGMTERTPLETANSAGTNANPLYLNTILKAGNNTYKTKFLKNLDMVLAGKWFTPEHYERLYKFYKRSYEKDARPNDHLFFSGQGLVTSRFVFSLKGVSDKSGTSANLSVAEYMRLKRIAAAQR